MKNSAPGYVGRLSTGFGRIGKRWSAYWRLARIRTARSLSSGYNTGGNPDLAGVREREALAKLPEAVRMEWKQLWQGIEALRQRAATPSTKVAPIQTNDGSEKGHPDKPSGNAAAPAEFFPRPLASHTPPR